MKYISTLLSLLLCINFLNAQFIEGTVVDSINTETVKYAHVYNASKGLVTSCDSLAHFKIKADIGDTLLFSAVGYYWKKIAIESSQTITIKLENSVYELDEVVINNPLSKEQFIRQILSMKVTDSLPFYIAGLPKVKASPKTDMLPSIPMGSPITAMYNVFSKKAQNRFKAIELESRSYKIPIILKKFNPEIVSEITELEGDKLELFIVFCNFSDDYLYKVSEYNLYVAIMFKLEQFKNTSINPKDTVEIDTIGRS